MLPQALGLDRNTRAAALRESIYRLHGRREVDDIETALEVFRQRGVGEIDDQIAALLAQVDADRAV